MSKYPQEPRVFGSHPDYITDIAISPDSRLLTSISVDGTTRVWDITTGTPLLYIDMAARIQCTAFSPDGRFAAVGRWGGPVFWDIQTDNLYRPWQDEDLSIDRLAFSPDGRTLLVMKGFYDRDTAELRVAQTGELLRTFPESPVFNIPFSSDGRTFLTGWYRDTVQLKDIATGETIRTFTGHTDQVRSAVFSPDGRTILTGSEDATARLWDVATGEVIHIFERHYKTVTDVAFSLNGRYAVTCSHDESVRFWNVATGENFSRLTPRTFPVSRVRFTPDGRYIILASFKEVQVWVNELDAT